MSISKVGYQIYMREVKNRVMTDIMRKGNSKSAPTTQTITNEIVTRWNSLPEYSREFYKKKAGK
tara:strand:- start:3335 stop:3526 length:192 start_codon:yes stop_codon:yes gene_type:complete